MAARARLDGTMNASPYPSATTAPAAAAMDSFSARGDAARTARIIPDRSAASDSSRTP
jgi:hypothetical protein